jgi:fatty acid desaturase
VLAGAGQIDLERPFKAAGAVALPTLALSVVVLAGFTTTVWAAARGNLPLVVAVPLQALWGYLAFTPAHEAVHGNIAGKNVRIRGLEALLGWIMSALLALPFPMLEYLHLQHHGHTNVPDDDPDYRVASTGVLSVALHCWTVQLGYLRVMQRRLRDGSLAAKKALGGMRVYAAASLVLLVASVRYDFWQWALLLWILPMWIAQGFLALVFDWLPHHPHASRERYKDTRVVLGTGREMLLLGQNYHLIHHLYPRVPFYRYARCFRTVEPVLRANGSSIT